jgi:hypothetical protein
MVPEWLRQIRISRCLWIVILLLSLTPLLTARVYAAKKGEAINSAPDSNTAGLLNTELIPETGFQVDVTTGNVWYGITENANLLVNVFAASRTLLAKPMFAVGGKIRYCETVKLSCSLTAVAAPGLEFGSSKKRVLGLLVQHGVAVDFESAGRFILGLGAASYSERSFSAAANGYYDRMASWINFLYDFAASPEWSFGAGYSPSIKTLSQEFLDDNLLVSRYGFAGAGFFHLRAQFSVWDWQFSGGGGILAAGDNWSLWPVLEVIWRIPDTFFMSEEEAHEE